MVRIRTEEPKYSMITLTEKAHEQIDTLFEEEGNYNLYLRLFIEGGGCAGMNYGFVFEEERQDDDFEIDMGNWSLIIDPMSNEYLDGSEIDYVTSIVGSRFTLKNSNFKSTCGCGSSFAI